MTRFLIFWIYVAFLIRFLIISFIDGNGIDDEGAKAIGTALINNYTLTNLNLCMFFCFILLITSLLFIDNNKIGAEGAKAIGTALINNYVLTNLGLCICSASFL